MRNFLKSESSVYIIRRVLYAIPVVFAVITFAFILLKLAPGDPATLLAGEGATPQYIKNMRSIYGLDKPITEQYIIYVSKLLTGDWGFSISYERPVLDVILERLPATLILAGSALMMSVVFGIILGTIAAVKRESVADYVISSVSMILYSIPVFVLAEFLILFFSVEYKIFPISGFVSIRASTENMFAYTTDILWHLVLPSISLALLLMAYFVRLTRSSTIEVLSSNYIVAARARGIPPNKVLFKHALKNALIPVVTMAGIQLAAMVGGVVITETIFAWPGIGRLTMDAIQSRDYPLITGIFIFVTISVIIINIITDYIYTVLDPRVRLR